MRGVVAISGDRHPALRGRGRSLSHDWFLLAAALSRAASAAWLLYFLVQAIIGTLALRVESAASLFDAWLGFFQHPLRIPGPAPISFPGRRAQASRWCWPFRFQLSFPVELMPRGRWSPVEALQLLGAQWAYVPSSSSW